MSYLFILCIAGVCRVADVGLSAEQCQNSIIEGGIVAAAASLDESAPLERAAVTCSPAYTEGEQWREWRIGDVVDLR